MANRKVTPLKDEPGTSLEDIQVELSNCIQAINNLSGKIDTLAKPTANDTSSLKDAVGKAAANEVRLLLEARQRKFEEEEEAAKARGEITQQEYFQIVTNLAKKYPEIKLSDKELCAEANKWELSHGGISGRTAQQFINYLLGKQE